MVKRVAKARMLTSALGNPEAMVARPHGFTLLELLLVVTLAALTAASVTLSLRDNAHTQLDQEAQRLSALLEAARAQARTSGVAVVWQPQPRGFKVDAQYRAWLVPGTTVTRMPPHPPHPAPADPAIWLPPEPLMPPQRLRLSLEGRDVWLGTNGVAPWRVLEGADAPL